MTGPSADHSARSRTPVRSSSAAGRTRSKLISTITSVPPARGSAPGLAALTASASDQVAGRKNSMTHSTAGPAAPGQARNHRIGGGEERIVCAFLQGSVNVIMGSRPEDPGPARDHGIGAVPGRYFHDPEGFSITPLESFRIMKRPGWDGGLPGARSGAGVVHREAGGAAAGVAGGAGPAVAGAGGGRRPGPAGRRGVHHRPARPAPVPVRR